MHRTFTLIMLVVVVVFSKFACIRNAFGEDFKSEVDIQAETMLRDILDQRTRLTSGVFRGVGEKYNSPNSGVPEVKGAVRVFVAFDDNRGLFRFDSEHPIFLQSMSSDGSSKTEGIEQTKVRWIRTPDLTADWTKTTKMNFQYLHIRNAGSALQSSAFFYPFDIREAGLIHYMQFDQNQGVVKTIGDLLQLKCSEIRKQDEDRKWLVLKHDWGDFELLVDTKHGMTATSPLIGSQ